jgi:hypothetical protein
VENFKHSFDMDSYAYYTQIMQAETLASAYRLWRRNWMGKGMEYTSGALVWQVRFRFLNLHFHYNALFINCPCSLSAISIVRTSDQRLLACHVLGHC